ncbi:MAG: YfiR family protein [Opitutaceae bacterium]|nr:YfiR family protein [Opitutaceae bacterium]
MNLCSSPIPPTNPRPSGPSCGRTPLKCIGLLLLLALSFVPRSHGQTGTQAEYEIKAALLYKLLSYVEWPSSPLAPADAPFTIGILGQDPSGKALMVLTAILSDKVIKGRRIVVRLLTNPAEIDQCQLLFISASEKARLAEITESIKDRPVLTVGEIAGFAERGGHVNLRTEGNIVNLEINNDTASRSGLTISSQLLKLKLVKVVKS